MPKLVYIETTIPSYLAAWPARDLLQAARQQMTHEWWHHKRANFELCTSQVVLLEAADGDADAAARRSAFLQGLSLLDVTSEADQLADAILRSGLLPAKAARDALHIGVSAVHAVDILLTWNCRHIANATIMRELSDLVMFHGYQAPILCTPLQLLEEPYEFPEE